MTAPSTCHPARPGERYAPVLFIDIAGAMQGMLTVNNGVIADGQAMLVTICLVLGTLVGEIINIEGLFERFGEWLKIGV